LRRDVTAAAPAEPKFAAEIGLLALQRLLDGSGYDPGVSLILDAFGHLMGAASRIGAQAWATQQAQRLAEGPCNIPPVYVDVPETGSRTKKDAPFGGMLSAHRRPP